MAPAFALRNEFAPTNPFGIAAAGQASPVFGLGADTYGIAISVYGLARTEAVCRYFEVGRNLLSPVSRHAAAYGEDPQVFMLAYAIREVFEV